MTATQRHKDKISLAGIATELVDADDEVTEVDRAAPLGVQRFEEVVLVVIGDVEVTQHIREGLLSA
eukprot:CAMPEP_0171070512 /NCGR_PEP_ID=MMETSP0766_2-20121228/9795_1 /TAXON_ID=439317 /ORGANISM="Gambierdiscus australes, Strain CAWD 149" /LENGTH=65 /DNA_ID=CAMNT_0011526995 /DNA_START=206 /DNA_END=404 /DNA_ORIENTATION=+